MSRILVVDDDAPTRESLARLLTAAGHSAVIAFNGRDAWLTLYEGLPDLILLDLMMPQMDGITFLRLLRRSDHWGRLPVLVVTGFSDDDGLVGEAKQLGVTDVISKMGCDAGGLLSAVERTLGSSAPAPSVRPAARQTARRAMACGAA